jgi:hypothetical protein
MPRSTVRDVLDSFEALQKVIDGIHALGEFHRGPVWDENDDLSAELLLDASKSLSAVASVVCKALREQIREGVPTRAAA